MVRLSPEKDGSVLSIPQQTTDPDSQILRTSDLTSNVIGTIRSKILYVLSIYPKLSPSMLQVGIGPSISPTIWRPILTELVREGLVSKQEEERTSNNGRFHRYDVLSLTEVGRKLISPIPIPVPAE